jgi:hypothetical protein
MKRLRSYALSLVAATSLVTVVLLVTGWDSAVASHLSSVIVTNTATNPVQVQAVGTVPVHEQGTANVNVTNSNLTLSAEPPITGGGMSELIPVTGGADNHVRPGINIASALVIHMTPGVSSLVFRFNGTPVTAFSGPANLGGSDVELSLTRPIEFDEITCQNAGLQTDHCAVSWIGNR